MAFHNILSSQRSRQNSDHLARGSRLGGGGRGGGAFGGWGRDREMRRGGDCGVCFLGGDAGVLGSGHIGLFVRDTDWLVCSGVGDVTDGHVGDSGDCHVGWPQSRLVHDLRRMDLRNVCCNIYRYVGRHVRLGLGDVGRRGGRRRGRGCTDFAGVGAVVEDGAGGADGAPSEVVDVVGGRGVAEVDGLGVDANGQIALVHHQARGTLLADEQLPVEAGRGGGAADRLAGKAAGVEEGAQAAGGALEGRRVVDLPRLHRARQADEPVVDEEHLAVAGPAGALGDVEEGSRLTGVAGLLAQVVERVPGTSEADVLPRSDVGLADGAVGEVVLGEHALQFGDVTRLGGSAVVPVAGRQVVLEEQLHGGLHWRGRVRHLVAVVPRHRLAHQFDVLIGSFEHLVGRAEEGVEGRRACDDVDGDGLLLDGVVKVAADLDGVEGALLGTHLVVAVYEEAIVDEHLLDGLDAHMDLQEGPFQLRVLVLVVNEQRTPDETCVVVHSVYLVHKTKEVSVLRRVVLVAVQRGRPLMDCTGCSRRSHSTIHR
jgi:hypothetical protein